MNTQVTATAASQRNTGWVVTFAAMGINLALGVLYTWSVISKGIPAEWGWTEADKSWPYSICCLVFCLAMIPAGRMQDRVGPRTVATIGGALVGLGLIIASLTATPLGYVIGFGILAGTGIGFGYASATPPAIKWFSAARTGLIAGVVVSGFGLASVYIAPLASALIGSYGVATTVLVFGIGFLLVVTGLAQFLKPPPAGYIPPDCGKVSAANHSGPEVDYAPSEMLRTWQFYALWFLYACGAGAGLMVIAKLATIVQLQAGIAVGFWFVAVLAIGNGFGRIAAGVLSDRIGRRVTMSLCFVMQALLVVLLSRATPDSLLANAAVLAVISALIGANYGANLALFPAITKDYYGSKNFGTNYGLVFTAWGVGGFMLALLAGKVYDRTGTFDFAYYCSIALLVVAAAVACTMRQPHTRREVRLAH
ncbi:MAG: L-lactate MFS transporter [Planctomycetota bacterium]|jgi:OFA family oxalate/formate antiporter-like MFS transporter